MDRCPNCGAPARPGAKFCTTCGYRLPTVVAPEAPADTGSAAAASTSSWPPAPMAEGPPIPTEGEQGQATDEVVAMPEEPTPGDAGTESEDTAAETEQQPSTDSVLSSSWPSAPASSEPTPWSSDDAAPTEETVAGDDVAADVTVEEETVVVPAPASQYESWSTAIVEEHHEESTPLGRASALLDELRALLPALGSATESDDVATVVEELRAAITPPDDTAAAERDALRAALDQARDNPRDIETLLSLSQQADAAISLLDDYDRLVAAIEKAMASLQSKAPHES